MKGSGSIGAIVSGISVTRGVVIMPVLSHRDGRRYV
jgi:hypothetical protein